MNQEAIEHAVACMRGDPKAIAEHYAREAECGWYYLHTNGALIYKRFEPEVEQGGFVRKVWQIDTRDRLTAWRLLSEATDMGADMSRIRELCEKWGCTFNDMGEYIVREKNPSPARMKGLRKLTKEIFDIDIDRAFDLASEQNKWPTVEQCQVRKETNGT